MRRSPFRSLLCVWLAASIGAGGCRAPIATTTTPAPKAVNSPAAIAAATTSDGRPQIPIEDDAGGHITMRTADPKVASASAEIAALTDAETAALHARMEPLPDVSAYNAHAPIVRPPSAAPASATPTNPIAFVVPTGKAVSDAPIAPGKVTAPLQPPQITPRDEVRAESEIRVRFSEPMIPVAAVGTVATPKIDIRPAVRGSWRWIDTRVLQFTAVPRFMQATEFEVTVQPGVEAISGARLATATTQKFSTPPIQLSGLYPRNEIRPDAPIAVRLSHDGNADQLAQKLRVTAAKRPLPFKVIDLDAAKALWARDPSKPWDPKTADLQPNRYVILAPASGAWPAGTELRVTLDKNAPSAEGPRRSTEASDASIEVVKPFTLLGIACQQNPNLSEDPKPRMLGNRCPANGWLSVVHTNNIAEKTYRAQKYQLAGEEFEDHSISGNAVGMSTPKAVGRAYQLTVGDGVEDIYGQPLLGSRALSFVTSIEQFYATLQAPSGLHVLDPRFEIPQWVVHTSAISSVRVQLYQVTPKDYFAYTAFENNEVTTPPGKKIFDETHAVGGRYAGTLRADLRPALTDGFGHVIAVATATPAPGNPKLGRVAAWIQVTHLGASARIDAEKISAVVHELSPTKGFLSPRAGVDAALVFEAKGEQSTGTSDANGKVALDLLPRGPRLPNGNFEHPRALLRLSSGADTSFSVFDRYEKSQRVNDALWYVTDDRFTYKPGEAVYVKGWVRWTHSGPNPELSMPKAGETVAYSLVDSRGSKIASGTLPLTDQGGFHAEVALPKNINLGQASFTFSTRTDTVRHPIAVQEFRTPAYSVSLDDDVSHRGSIPLIVGESIEMTVGARYYAGGGLGGAAVDWSASLSNTSYEPPGWSSYQFTPPNRRSYRAYRDYGEPASTSVAQAGSLSGASTASMTYGLAALPRKRPSVLSVDATVTDVDRMSIRATSRAILVHPSAYYVGLRMKPREVGILQAIVTDIDGNVVKGVPVEVAIESVLGSEQFRDDAKIVDTVTCKLTSGADPVDCKFAIKLDHAYTGTARVADPRGRTNVAAMTLPWWGGDDKKDLQLIADKALYRPGDTARIEVRSQVFPADATLTYARQGVIEQKRIQLTAASTTVELPITVGHIKNLFVQVDRYAKRRYQKGTAPLPEVVSAEVAIKVDVESARLDVRARSTAKLVQPGDEATFEIDVARDGKPVAGAEVALIVVDEAILALSAGSHADPLMPFYRDVASGTWSWNTFRLVHDSGDVLAGKPGFQRYELGGGGSGWGTLGTGSYGSIGHGSGSGSGYGSSIVTARKDFRPTAVFSPTLHTDQRGHASVTVKMPDSLTRFRIVALATASTNYFGKGENTIVTQRKVNARTVAPRFLTQGDQFSLPVVVQNLDAKPRTVLVAVRAANLTGKGPAGKRVTIPGGQRAEVRFDFATQRRGKAVIQTLMTSGAFADASTVELPIYEPATTEAFATYGVVETEPQREQLAIPKDVFPEVGGVEVEVASTQLQSLVDAYWYLQAYPYECAEQRSGRMLATTAMYDILDAFATPGRPSKSELEAQRQKDVVALAKTQNADGGWGYFGGMRSDPMVSMQVLSALGKDKSDTAQKATKFATKELTALFGTLATKVATRDRKKTPDEDAYQVSLAAHVLSNLASVGQDMRGRAEQLHGLAIALKAYPIDAQARVLAVLAKLDRAKAIRTKLTSDLLSATRETAASASVTTSFVEGERLMLVSAVKTNALVLDALIRERPDHPVIQKLARGVLDGRKHGRWMSTQENLVALQSLRRFFDVYEKATPNYVGKLWLGTASYAEQSFVGRSTARGVAQASWSALAPGSSHDLVFARDGSAGRLYYRVGIVYAPKQIDLPALDAGFIVRRSYTAADDPSDVIKHADGSYKIKLGAKVVVTIETTNTTTRHGVAVVDPMPAGFEAVNTALATAERAAKVDAGNWDHQNLRDNRAEAFTMELPAGTHRYAYTVRATTPGTFIAAPAKAEEMYAPETFGRSTGMRVVVE